MVMAAPVVLMLVAGDAIVEGHFAGQPAFGQELQGAVDRGVADAGILLLDKAVKLVGGEMVASLKECAEDGIALSSLLQAHTFEMPMENFLGLSDHLAGNGGLIVNALLQHGGKSEYHPGLLKMKFIFSLCGALPGIQSKILYEHDG